MKTWQDVKKFLESQPSRDGTLTQDVNLFTELVAEYEEGDYTDLGSMMEYIMPKLQGDNDKPVAGSHDALEAASWER